MDEEDQAAAGDVRLLRVLKSVRSSGRRRRPSPGPGANPRKGNSHTWVDVEKKLCDVIVTAQVALRTINPETEKVLDARVQRYLERPTLSANAPLSRSQGDWARGSGMPRPGLRWRGARP
nr:hypothetical protein [Streptomyces sp. SID8352]